MKFIAWLSIGQRPAALLGLGIVLLSCFIIGSDLIGRASHLPVPIDEKAISWIDYWLFRYQTLVAGVLAVAAGGFAIAAAGISIRYDRRKTTDHDALVRRRGIENIAKGIEYMIRTIFVCHSHISNAQEFPAGVYPAVLIDEAFFERTVLKNAEYLPRGIANRCMFLIAAVRIHNRKIQNLVDDKTFFPPVDFPSIFLMKLVFLHDLEGLLFCGDIILLQLQALARTVEGQFWEEVFDIIDVKTLQPLMHNRQIAPERMPYWLRDLGLDVVEWKTNATS